MLLGIFKTSQPLSWILILSLLLMGRFVLFFLFFDPTYIPENVTLVGTMTHYLGSNYPWSSHFLSALILIPSGFFFNKIAQDTNLFKGIHYLLFFFFALFSSYSPANLIVTPFLISIPLLLVSLAMILSQSKGKISLATVFNSSFLIGAGTAIYYPNIIMFGMLFISIFYLSKITWRAFIVAIIGLFAPFVIQDAIAFSLNETVYYLTNSVELFHSSFNIHHIAPILSSAVLMGLTAFQLPLFYKTSSKSIIKIRKALFLILFSFVLSLVFASFIQTDNGQWLNMMIIPISILFTLFHMEVKKWWLGDMAFLALIGCMVMNYMYI